MKLKKKEIFFSFTMYFKFLFCLCLEIYIYLFSEIKDLSYYFLLGLFPGTTLFGSSTSCVIDGGKGIFLITGI